MLITIDSLPDVSLVMLHPGKSVSLQFRFTKGLFSKEAAMFNKQRINSEVQDRVL